MTDKIKLILKYGEQRRSLFLNAHNKDDYGRHRGQVLYGMTLGGSGTVVTIAPGAVYTSQGQRLFLDVPDASVDLGPSGTNVFSGGNKAEYPICVMIFLSYQYNVAQIAQAVEATSAIGLVGASISARIVPFDRNNAAPTYNLLPLDPVTLDTLQPSGYTSIQTWNGPAVNAESTANKQADSIQFGEIPLGYVMLGVNPTNNALPTDLSSAGVSIVGYRNAFDMVSDLIGMDVLLPRAANNVTGALVSPSTGTALKQGYTARTTNIKPSPPLAVPRFGTPENGGSNTRVDSPFNTYRQPNFFRDGDSILEALRRLDIILRQFANRTGDQYLVSLFQDSIDSNIPLQGTIEQILAYADGSAISTNNLNSKTYATGASGGDPINHVLKSGVIPHVEDTLIGKLSTQEGDSLTSAVTALDLAISVILDSLGQSIPRSQLRAGVGSFTPAAWGDVPEGLPALAVPTIGGATTSPYLTTQSTHDAIIELAKRTLATPGTNWLANAGFWAGNATSGNQASPPPYWNINGATGTWSASDRIAGAYAGSDMAVALAANAFFDQDIIGAAADNFIGQAIDSSSYLSFSAVIQNTGSFPITIDVIGYSDTGGTTGVFSITSAAIAAGGNRRLVTATAKITAGTTINRLKFRVRAVTGANAVAFNISGASLNTGTPINISEANSAPVDFVSRDGGSRRQMRGDLYLGGFKAKNMADGVAATDAVTKQQLDTKAPLDSPALINVPTAPTAAPGTNTTQLATTAFVTTAVGSAAPVRALNDGSVNSSSIASIAAASSVMPRGFSASVWIDVRTPLFVAPSPGSLKQLAHLEVQIDANISGYTSEAGHAAGPRPNHLADSLSGSSVTCGNYVIFYFEVWTLAAGGALIKAPWAMDYSIGFLPVTNVYKLPDATADAQKGADPYLRWPRLVGTDYTGPNILGTYQSNAGNDGFAGNNPFLTPSLDRIGFIYSCGGSNNAGGVHTVGILLPPVTVSTPDTAYLRVYYSSYSGWGTSSGARPGVNYIKTQTAVP